MPEDPPQDIPPRHLTWVRSIPAHLLDYHYYTALTTLHEPHTYREASTDPLWQIAIKEELDALTKNHTWDLITLPPRQSVVGCKQWRLQEFFLGCAQWRLQEFFPNVLLFSCFINLFVFYKL